MLPRKQHVTRRRFQEILTQGTRYHTPLLSLCMLRTATSPPQVSFSFMVSKKIARSAAARNRMRRRGSAIARSLYLEILSTIEGVVFFKKGSEKLSFSDLQQEVRALFRKAHLLKHKSAREASVSLKTDT